MPADPILQPNPRDMELATLRKINQIASGLVAPDPDLASGPRDIEFMSLRKINQLLWNLLDAGGDFVISAWQPCTYQPGWSGSLQARTIRKGATGLGIIQMSGNIQGTPWTATTTVANMPIDIVPTSGSRSLLVPSSQGSGVADGISSLVVSSTGAISLGILAGTNQAVAFFDGIIFAI